MVRHWLLLCCMLSSIITTSQQAPFVIISNTQLSQSDSLLFETQLLKHLHSIELTDNVDKFEHYIERELRNNTGMRVGIFANNVEELTDVVLTSKDTQSSIDILVKERQATSKAVGTLLLEKINKARNQNIKLRYVMSAFDNQEATGNDANETVTTMRQIMRRRKLKPPDSFLQLSYCEMFCGINGNHTGFHSPQLDFIGQADEEREPSSGCNMSVLAHLQKLKGLQLDVILNETMFDLTDSECAYDTYDIEEDDALEEEDISLLASSSSYINELSYINATHYTDEFVMQPYFNSSLLFNSHNIPTLRVSLREYDEKKRGDKHGSKYDFYDNLSPISMLLNILSVYQPYIEDFQNLKNKLLKIEVQIDRNRHKYTPDHFNGIKSELRSGNINRTRLEIIEMEKSLNKFEYNTLKEKEEHNEYILSELIGVSSDILSVLYDSDIDQREEYNRRNNYTSYFKTSSLFSTSQFCEFIVEHAITKKKSKAESMSERHNKAHDTNEEVSDLGSSMLSHHAQFQHQDGTKRRKLRYHKQLSPRKNVNQTLRDNVDYVKFDHENSGDQPAMTMTRSSGANTAVCLVGSTRTLLRRDTRDNLIYRFFAGYGMSNLWTFAVLSNFPDVEDRSHILNVLSQLNAVSVEWCEEGYTSLGGSCEASHAEMQLAQWAKCLGWIEQYERVQGARFDSVIKLRPDDLWYGAMLPHCTLNTNTKGYISKQAERWSDQWFSLPRPVATPILELVHTHMKPFCDLRESDFSLMKKAGDPGLELLIFRHIHYYATAYNTSMKALFLPRILGRTTDHSLSDIQEKCSRFLPSVELKDCVNTLQGNDPPLKDT